MNQSERGRAVVAESLARFDNHDPRLPYYDLMLEGSLADLPDLPLPPGYRFVLYEPGDEADWLDIEISARELIGPEQGREVWQRYYGGREESLRDRMFFVEDGRGRRLATATAYWDILRGDNGIDGWLHWVAVRREAQGLGLSKPLITRVLRRMKDLGYARAVIHTQTTTWLACKVYLDLGFRPIPDNAASSRKGWEIVRRLTDHPALASFAMAEDADLLPGSGAAKEEST